MARAFEVDALLLFSEVVRSGNLTRASDATGLSKATISRRLASLEEQVGALLLKRNSRSLAPTPIGTRLLEYAQRIDAEVKDARIEIDELQSGTGGTLRVSIPMEFGNAWLGRAVADFAVEYPEISLFISTNNGVVDLVREQFDIAIILGKLPDSRLIYRKLTSLRRAAYASPKYVEKHGLPKIIDELPHHRCIVTEVQQKDGVWTFLKRAQRKRVEVAAHTTVANISLVRELVLSGVGIGILNDVLATNDIKAGRLVRVLPDWESPPLYTSAVMLKRTLIPKRNRLFLDFMVQRLR
ncbi:LysR family transcriptional regulator [Bradyrhizobium sp. KB893862 SZCCT0404]|uniref:LysR family transcriptional regulator n=1 Tax=Bradyrhizobium sp. KB893862 SZCCT0404 TaxID=2807672 RepID=UPI001BA888D0|nr:LysR family transcriptional regulator [Bradyrhizobium sp. KB893862 SZCCT0404]MBR1177009.1 LysR family transcriptional regulator [Bradyrhizobium sp. KB893862 SZCCT0404]